MSSMYFSRQPIVSLDESFEAYEVMYKDTKEKGIQEHFFSNTLAVNSISSKHKAFVQVDKKLLMSDSILSVAHDTFILSLSDDVTLDEQTIERIEQLHTQGFAISIHNRDLSEESILAYAEVIDSLEYFKINMSRDIEESQKELLHFLQKQNIKVIATQIETKQGYEQAKSFGCDLYQGYWFAKSELEESASFNPSEFKELQLYNTLTSNITNDELVLEFEKAPELSAQLLEFVNTSNIDLGKEVSSFAELLTLVSRKSLSTSLVLMTYSQSTPLSLMAKGRVELMQNLLKALKPDVNNNALAEAHLIGALSLLGSVFKAKLSDVLENMNVSDISKQALLHDAGALGKIYKLVRDIEDFDASEIVLFTSKYKVEEEAIEEAILKSMEDVNTFEMAVSAS